MLLLHQTGSVKVGEVVRYTLTYTPSLDRILPPPTQLHVKVKNTSAIPLRAAYLHGPYTLYAACYPSTFDPYKKNDRIKEEGEPDYEPQLKAGGSWNAKLTVPEEIRQGGAEGAHNKRNERKNFTWIIEVSSQVLFSTTASVHYEVLVGRDEKSVSLGLNGIVSSHGMPGKLEDQQHGHRRENAQPKGVFSKAISLKVQDTAALWDMPPFPQDVDEDSKRSQQQKDDPGSKPPKRKQTRIHLVIITHGLHSNLGADMLYMKECIDAAAKQAREDARRKNAELFEKKAREQNDYGREAIDQRSQSAPEAVIAPTENVDDNEDEEQILVRGFSNNAVKTEKGIQYLGKRLAKYVLSITYPDQPYLPVKSSISQSITRTLTGGLKGSPPDGTKPSHQNSSIVKDEKDLNQNLPYKITSISFIGHSLGGLTQTYAVAYIQKHSPEFFDKIRPINFVGMASPFLGLSNENPIYVKFALDFGLVGRTGQDLGLTWRAPTIARNGWGAMVGGLGSDNSKEKEPDPGAKPLLRILPTGPAHIALKKFRNRTVYSNVVNDGIVPLRTSCLLFLDWRGLSRVEKARRENGLVGTMVNWGLNEITGQNASAPRRGLFNDLFSDSGDETKPSSRASADPGSTVPQADAGQGLDQESFAVDDPDGEPDTSQRLEHHKSPDSADGTNFWTTFTSFFRPQAGSKKPKQHKIYRRGQTMKHSSEDSEGGSEFHEDQDNKEPNPREGLVRGSSLYTNGSDNDGLEAPPKTTVFESAGDLLSPPLPPKEFLLDPSKRPRTIFHDRVYHPEDIPPPPAKRQRTFMRKSPVRDESTPDQAHGDLQKSSSSASLEQGTMRIEEKIARAYHKDMSWRKVLVRLEPDAHNNMIVRRMFANAYGWPVVKHMCDTHFAYTATAKTKDADESPDDRVKSQTKDFGKDGEEVMNQVKPPDDKKIEDLKRETKNVNSVSAEDLPHKENEDVDVIHERLQKLRTAQRQPSATRNARTPSELRESRDEISDLVSMVSAQGAPSSSFSSMHSGTAALHRLARQDSGRWSDRFFEGSEDESEDEGFLSQELRQARDRGKIVGLGATPRSTKFDNSDEDGRDTPLASNIPKKSVLSDGDKKIVAEPEQLSRTPSKDIASDPLTLTLSGVGLGKAPQDKVTEGIDHRRRPSADQSISEQVAIAQSQALSPKQSEDNAS